MSSSLDQVLSNDEIVSLGPHANVVLAPTGFTLPQLGEKSRLRLEPGHLALISVLSSPVEDRPALRAQVLDPLTETTDWARVVADLRERELLLPGPPIEGVPSADDTPPAGDGTVPEPPRATGAYALVVTPVALHPRAGTFELVDRSGHVVTRFTLDDLPVLASFCKPTEVSRVPGSEALLEALEGTPYLVRQDSSKAPADALQLAERVRVLETERRQTLIAAIDDRESARLRPADPTGERSLLRVFPVSHPLQFPNSALGLIFAYAQHYKGGALRQKYDLEPYWMVRRSSVRRLLEQHGPSIFLFSNYLWSSSSNLALSRLIKEISPESLTIHGGPDVPRYEADTERFLREHPYVDVAARNEGEITTAEILEVLDGELVGDATDRRRLRDVAGIAYLDGDQVVRTPDRERISDLDSLPSAYLTGVFDVYGEAGAPLVILETNRGCPYGCTFCDWGSATLSRLRKFSIDRVFAEIDWVSEHHQPRMYFADANFGIFERDVEIAAYLAESVKKHGFPRLVQTSFAKNTVKHIEKIVSIWVEAGISTEGVLSLQTTDPDTLSAVQRKNIKTEKYLDLAATFRREKLPLFTDLMLGLPGSTFESFVNDLQFTIDNVVPARVFRTELLVNTPMNDPEYRKKHQIEIESVDSNEMHGTVAARRKSLVVSTSSFTAEDLYRCLQLRSIYALAENYGTMRHLARYTRQAIGLREVEMYIELEQRSRRSPGSYPYIRWALDSLANCAIPPVSWRRFFDEIKGFLVTELGVPDDGALRTVMAVQEALVPDRGRVFPETLKLEHDYADWFHRTFEARDAGEDWWVTVPPLSSFGPGVLEVRDEADICGLGMGGQMDMTMDGNWELGSEVSRSMPRQHLAV